MHSIDTLLMDRDGTVIADRHYLSDPDGVELIDGAGAALARLCAAGLRLFVVSNQSGVGRGYFSDAAARACNCRMEELLADAGAHVESTVFCPHAPEEGCPCRKPAPGMWERLSRACGLDARTCAMAGDKLEDLEFAVAAGLALRILVLTGKGAASAAALGLPASAREPLFFPAPASSRHPHLVLPSLAFLDAGLLRRAGAKA